MTVKNVERPTFDCCCFSTIGDNVVEGAGAQDLFDGGVSSLEKEETR